MKGLSYLRYHPDCAGLYVGSKPTEMAPFADEDSIELTRQDINIHKTPYIQNICGARVF